MKIAAALAIVLCLAASPATAETLPDLGPAPPFSLISQDKKPVSLTLLRGNVVAVTFLYTACPDICPLLTQKMLDVQEKLAPDIAGRIAFVAITLDPERDTPDILKDYAAAYGADRGAWFFLSGPAASVREVARRYGVVAMKNAEGFIDHNLVTSIVDARGVLRVQYLGMRFNSEEFRRDLESLARGS